MKKIIPTGAVPKYDIRINSADFYLSAEECAAILAEAFANPGLAVSKVEAYYAPLEDARREDGARLVKAIRSGSEREFWRLDTAVCDTGLEILGGKIYAEFLKRRAYIEAWQAAEAAQREGERAGARFAQAWARFQRDCLDQ